MSTYYILAVLNHEKKRFEFRIEDAPDGRHSLAAYVKYMNEQLEKVRRGEIKEFWGHLNWHHILADLENCQQITIGTIEAPDLKEARKIGKGIRKLIKAGYRAAGYRSFYEHASEDEHDAE